MKVTFTAEAKATAGTVFTTAQANIVKAIVAEAVATDRTDFALIGLGMAAAEALANGWTTRTLAKLNEDTLAEAKAQAIAKAIASGMSRDKAEAKAETQAKAPGMTEILFTAPASIAYLSGMGRIYGLAIAEDDTLPMPDAKAVLSIVRRTYKPNANLPKAVKATLGAPCLARALRTGTQEGAVAYLQGALKMATAEQAKAKAEASEASEATAEATLTIILQDALARLTAGEALTADGANALTGINAHVTAQAKVRREASAQAKAIRTAEAKAKAQAEATNVAPLPAWQAQRVVAVAS